MFLVAGDAVQSNSRQRREVDVQGVSSGQWVSECCRVAR